VHFWLHIFLNVLWTGLGMSLWI